VTADFVVSILEGFEGTLDAVLERLDQGLLRQEIEALQRHIEQKREQLARQHAPDRLAV
jgi:hypothetical protein